MGNGEQSALQAAEISVETDAVLVARAKQNQAEFAPLYLKYVDPVYRYCYRRLGGPDAAADATSLIFAKAISSIQTCSDTAFRSWLFSIAHNVLVDQLRARKVEEPLEAAVELHDPAPTPEEAALAGERRAEVRAMLDRLSPDQCRVVELRLAGLRSNEIGAVLGRSRGAVDAIQSRAVARLRELLEAPTVISEGNHAVR